MHYFGAWATAGDNSTTAMATILMFGMIESRTYSAYAGNLSQREETWLLTLAIKVDVRFAG
jgi:hypothetical protein